MEPILKVRDLNISYKTKGASVYAVKQVGFDLFKGDSLGIVGESGSGKSTLAMGILRLLPENMADINGEAQFNGVNLIDMNPKEMNRLRWKEIAVVFQKSMNALSPVHRISEQVADIYRVHFPKAGKDEIYERFRTLLEMVNLSDRVIHSYPHELSGGMLQRVSIAIGLLFEPKLLILDEATTALDVVTQGQILDEILKLQEYMDMTRIMITHDMSVVSQSCNKIAILYAGELMEHGMTRDVLTKPLHPYTVGLLDSFPTLYGEKQILQSIEGHLPDLSVRVDGCIFADRCKECLEICRLKKPVGVERAGRTVYCHLYTGEAV